MNRTREQILADLTAAAQGPLGLRSLAMTLRKAKALLVELREDGCDVAPSASTNRKTEYRNCCELFRGRLKRAIEAYPLLPPWEALIAWHRDHRADKIRGKSARKFFEEDARALQLVPRHRLGRTDPRALLAGLKSEIDHRRGRPKKYGAGKKARDVTEAEAIALFRELKRHAL